MILCVLYLYEVVRSRRNRIDGIEGFGNESENRIDNECYDSFYAKVYDSLVQPAARAGFEVQAPIDWITKTKPVGDIRVADIGCGTGLHVEIFRKLGVRSVVGYDRSEHMIAEAKRKFPESEFKTGDATDALMAAADQYDLVTMYYFTMYLVQKRTEMLKNIYLWLSPGGMFCCHIVNKLKFDPILESASPFLGFSVQKYSPERITKSIVNFDEFDYAGDFQLHGSRAMYEEEFRFKNGNIRKHEQRVYMPTIEAMVKEVEAVGFKMLHHIDLTPIGYEYQFLFFFGR